MKNNKDYSSGGGWTKKGRQLSTYLRPGDPAPDTAVCDVRGLDRLPFSRVLQNISVAPRRRP